MYIFGQETAKIDILISWLVRSLRSALHTGVILGSLDNYEQVDKVVQRRGPGDPCFAPRGRAGTCVLVVNSIGWVVSVFALIAVAWAPSSLNDEEEGGKNTSFGWAWTRDSMSLQADLVRGLWLKRYKSVVLLLFSLL